MLKFICFIRKCGSLQTIQGRDVNDVEDCLFSSFATVQKRMSSEMTFSLVLPQLKKRMSIKFLNVQKGSENTCKLIFS